jgi:hypothetical protein
MRWTPSIRSRASAGEVEFSEGDGPVQGKHRSRCEAEELVLERDDLRPVDLGSGVGVGVHALMAAWSWSRRAHEANLKFFAGWSAGKGNDRLG